MAEFAPPSGPPPLPEGWKAEFDNKFGRYYYANIYTKATQWEVPTQPARPENAATPPAGPPPGYSGSPAPQNQYNSQNPYQANQGQNMGHEAKLNPYDSQTYGHSVDEDAKLAARLQAEEDARVRGSSHSPYPPQSNNQNPYGNQGQGAAGDYYSQQHNGPTAGQGAYAGTPVGGGTYSNEQVGTRGEKKKGLFGKLGGALAAAKASQSHGSGYGQQPMMGGGYGQQPMMGGGYGQQPMMGGGYGGGYGRPMGGGMMGGGYGGGYGQPMYGRPQKAGGGGMGMAGGAAMGLGAGVLGGALIANAMDDHDDYGNGYQEGYEDGGGGDDGGDGGE